MSKLVKLRILGYSATILMHICNAWYMEWYKRNYPSFHEEAKVFSSLRYRYFTTWTFLLQIAYAVYGLGCDLFILKNAKKKDYKLPSPISDFRDIIFSALVWPCTMVVFSIFWVLYHYDRDLIFPEWLDDIIPRISNHVIHTIIVVVVLWEVVTRPRKEPENHARNISQLILHMCVYVSVLFFTYFERGVWLYPIFGKLFGTIYFVVAFAVIASIFLIFYYLQWPITNLIHGSKKQADKKKAKLDKKVK